MLKWVVRIFIGLLIIVSIMGVLGYFVLIPRPLTAPDRVANLPELESYLNELVVYNADSPPSVVMVVVKDGNIVYENGFGTIDPAGTIPATPETVYQYWSMTKPFTAVAILQLQEQGLLDIDAPVTNYLPYFEVIYPSGDSEDVTIRHLLNHSSGIPNNVPEIVSWIHFDGDPELDQSAFFEEQLPNYTRLNFEPGAQSVYTNVGYLGLAAFIESVSGQSYGDYMAEHILEPLAMANTGIAYNDDMLSQFAPGTHPSIDMTAFALPLLIDDMDALIDFRQDGVMWMNRVYSDQKGATGLIGSPRDAAQFVLMYLNEGTWNGAQILSPDSVVMMYAESLIEPGTSPESDNYNGVDLMMGLSWFVVEDNGRTYIAHQGGGPGYATEMRMYPQEGLGFVLMANGTNLPKREILDLAASLDW